MGYQFPHDRRHQRAVANIAAKVRTFYDNKTAFRIYHGSTNSTRKSSRNHENIIDISHLNHVLGVKISKGSKIAFVEPNVPMDQLVGETLKMGLIPPVVMEFPGITAGGGFAGTSGESSSFRHGLFDRTVLAIEVVLGDGDVVTASPDDPLTAEMFYAAAASFGTLGVVTLLALELVDAKPFVELTYERITGIDDAVLRINELSGEDNLDYLDGILFAQDLGVLCCGKLVDVVPQHGKLRTFSRPWDNWFYINAERLLEHEEQSVWTEYVPIQDYLFRYERGAFWISKYTYKYFAVPLNRFTRWLLDTYTHTRIMYSALQHSGLSSTYIIQDVSVPLESASKLVSYLDANFKNYPLWLCPIRLRGKSANSAYGLLADPPSLASDEKRAMVETTTQRPEMMLNFGVWGPGPPKYEDAVAWNRAFEAEIHALGGQKWLYAQTYYTEQEFWSSYGDRRRYDMIREKYHATSLPSIYDKVKTCGPGEAEITCGRSWWDQFLAIFWSIWPLAGLYGWLLCMINAEYLLPRRLSFVAIPQDTHQEERCGKEKTKIID
ncbi:Delta(24)-sterol reductase [Pseudocercospora fuligena]|uniref:Delta(24)-sterol reductase n=1 Tax=Pseudocercospora fuligena TaxID=685502 RepID=A0A8H6VHF1_9PEZI|nr:Delta(24)-sterol reductase [Pseudocercospora fuligena]